MNIPKFDVLGWAKFGAISGVLTALFMKVLPLIPTFQVTFSTIAVDLRSKVIGIGGEGLAKTAASYLLSLIGQDITVPGIAYVALGGALLLIGARFLFGFVGDLVPKGKLQRMVALLMLASLLQLFILQGIGVPALSVLFGFIVNAVVIGFGLNFVYDYFNMKVPD